MPMYPSLQMMLVTIMLSLPLIAFHCSFVPLNFIFARLHPENALSPMLVKPLPIVMLVSS